MYLKRLPALRAKIEAYREKTRNQEMIWREPMPVPTSRRSELYDYFFTPGEFEMEDGSYGGLLSIFTKNPNRKLDLRDPRGFMLVSAPYGSLDDIIVIFREHITEMGPGMILDSISVIKGMEPVLPDVKREAEEFNFLLNRELAILFALAVRDAQARSLMNTELHLSFLEGVTLNDC